MIDAMNAPELTTSTLAFDLSPNYSILLFALPMHGPDQPLQM